MVASLTVIDNKEGEHSSEHFSPHGCNPNGKCGNGMEKIYPTCAIRYGYMNYIGEFRYSPGMLFNCGAKVVIHSDRGIEIGQQVSLTCGGCDKSIKRETMLSYVKESGPDFMRPKSGRILRAATPQDLEEDRHLNRDADVKLLRARELARNMGMQMKFVACEHLFGGERIIFHFMSEARVDFRELVRELAHEYHTRIELHQVGARDEARLVADYEICGRECCCKNFLKTLRPVTMRMAKLQKATLDPTKVSGRCGRLRCCLRYEHEGYEDLNRRLPKVGTRVGTNRGTGTVRERQVLTQLLSIQYDTDGFVETVGSEIVQVMSDQSRFIPPEAPAGPPQRGRDRHRPGGPPDRRESRPPAAPPPSPPQATPGPEGSSPDAPGAEQERSGRSRRRGRRGRRGRRDGFGPAGPQDSPGGSSGRSPEEPGGGEARGGDAGPDSVG